MDREEYAEWSDKYPYDIDSMDTELIRAEIRELQNVIGEYNMSNDGYMEGMYYARLLDLIGALEFKTKLPWAEAMVKG